MKGNDRNQRAALTLLFGGVIFGILLAVVIVSGVTLAVLLRTGALDLVRLNPGGKYAFILMMAVISIVLGAVFAYLFGRLFMQPVNEVINAMNRLASGDFKTRIRFRSALRRHPTVEELTDSFNTMAEELEGTEMLRSDFINNFSHEFKTPIVSIAGFAKLLRRGNLTPEERDEYLGIIEDESMRLSDMATNVLNMTKVENQTILTDVTRFNLSEQLRRCVLLLEDKWTKKALDMNLDVGECMICGNEELLRQVWVNLLDNAVKFSPDGGTVELSAREENGAVTVRVANTGSEIEPDKLEHIWNKFYQADESHAAQGNGLGLSIVRSVVELHGGSVSAASRDDYTVFTVTLPAPETAA